MNKILMWVFILAKYKMTLLNQLKNHLKRSLINKISKRLLELEFKSNVSIKYVVKKTNLMFKL